MWDKIKYFIKAKSKNLHNDCDKHMKIKIKLQGDLQKLIKFVILKMHNLVIFVCVFKDNKIISGIFRRMFARIIELIFYIHE